MGLLDKLGVGKGSASGLESDNPLKRILSAQELGNSGKASAAEPLAAALEREQDDAAREQILRSAVMLYSYIAERVEIGEFQGSSVSAKDKEARERLRSVPAVAAATKELDEKTAAIFARARGEDSSLGD